MYKRRNFLVQGAGLVAAAATPLAWAGDDNQLVVALSSSMTWRWRWRDVFMERFFPGPAKRHGVTLRGTATTDLRFVEGAWGGVHCPPLPLFQSHGCSNRKSA